MKAGSLGKLLLFILIANAMSGFGGGGNTYTSPTSPDTDSQTDQNTNLSDANFYPEQNTSLPNEDPLPNQNTNTSNNHTSSNWKIDGQGIVPTYEEYPTQAPSIPTN